MGVSTGDVCSGAHDLVGVLQVVTISIYLTSGAIIKLENVPSWIFDDLQEKLTDHFKYGQRKHNRYIINDGNRRVVIVYSAIAAIDILTL